MRGLRRRLQIKKQVKKQVAKQIADATGPAGPPGAARAYAAVGAHFFNPCTGGTGGDECTFSQSKGITSVTRQSTGTYCVTAPGISSADVAAAVTVDWSNSNNPEGKRERNDLGGLGRMQRGGVRGSHGSPLRHDRRPGRWPNNVSAVGPAAAADDVAFTIVIP
jgi:hypothetical protein